MLQNPADPRCGLDIQTAYFALVGKLMSETAWLSHIADEVICLSHDVPAEHRPRLTDDVFVRWGFFQKLQALSPIAAEVYDEEHPTTVLLRTRAKEVNKMRNRVAHGYLSGVDPKRWSVDILTGITNTGYVEETIQLSELGRAVEDAREMLHHVTCLYSNMPGSPATPMDITTLE